jgi:hypothetical protein
VPALKSVMAEVCMYVFSHAMRTHAGRDEEGDDAMQAVVASSALNQEQEGPKKERSPLPSA